MEQGYKTQSTVPLSIRKNGLTTAAKEALRDVPPKKLVIHSDKARVRGICFNCRTDAHAQCASKTCQCCGTNTYRCDVLGCKREALRYEGSKFVGWLRFCSKHMDVATALSRYMSDHPHAKFMRLDSCGPILHTEGA